MLCPAKFRADWRRRREGGQALRGPAGGGGGVSLKKAAPCTWACVSLLRIWAASTLGIALRYHWA